MPFTLPPLPYDLNALTPHLSKETLGYHYGKHHQAYVNNLNTLIKNTEFENKSLEEIIKTANGRVFNNAAQIWNHTFYWNCLTPTINNPSAILLATITKQFGSLDQWREQFTKAALDLFGSGWIWLVKNTDDSLAILSASNASTPLTENKTPLLVCDVWEHAYYIDYRNQRAKYMEAYWNLVNWNFVEKQIQK
jgi:Fe-Mn family superoxide dismutase